MSFDIVKSADFPQAAFQYIPQEILGGNAIEDFNTLGGILSDLKHLWHAKGPCLEVRNTLSGRKVGSWTFGGILKDSNTKIIAVDELKRPHGRLPLLVVALECTISGGLIGVFDIFGSKVLRVVQVREQITSLHVIDSGCENSILPEPSPLRYFDGIVAVGTLGGNVYLLDICRQICEKGILNVDSNIRDELNPCPMIILNKEKIGNIRKYVERSVDREEHLAIHLNVVLNPSTEHFALKGENGEDRVHVNRAEAEVSSLFYSPQIASLLVGYNFGAFQLWDLRTLQLAYTSPICEEHIPVIHFTVQEPADDPKAYCYIWVSYSHNLMFHSGLPFAVMYSFYYENKNYVSRYGNLYEDFQHCSIRFQMELGDVETPSYNSHIKGGTCIGLQSINKYPINKDLHSLSLCLISWLVWNSHKEVSTCVLVFDLNQWYKEQMPREPNWSHCSNYIIKNSLSNQVLDVKLDQKSLGQFIGIQRLEEHFCPTALSFDLWCITDDSILKVHNKGLQQAFLDKIVKDQHLGLVRPEDYFEQITSLGLVPLFCEIHLTNSLDVDYHREILLSVALEQKLVGWLCKCTSKLANNAFNSSGLTIYNILNWAFARAIALKNACDRYCVSLFDYSGARLDNNTIVLLNSSIGQIRNICSLYRYVSNKLRHFISDKESLLEEQRSLENVVVYFEVLLWMVNIGLLPECQLKHYQRHDDSFTSAPYLVNDLTQYYNGKRAQLQMASHNTFVEKDCLLFIDNLISVKGSAEILRQQWQEDGGSGLYPPPSLQSVLRTYLLNGPDLTFKHCLVTYTLLDIAMTVDESNKVIKLLLKFPQIFDLSQSRIKIVQAFWHLDHDDYETALEYVLNPCVLTEDLHHWHHSVMMRSLLLQDQSSLALLYLQIRKPSIHDEKDLLTVLSLLISKNMLDEAFKFRQQHQNPNEQALLLHIFNECNKNELLHSLLYRRLNDGEERAFFKYLQNTKNPRCEDLKVFYYLLRSRFLEAFDSYSLTKKTKPENQGLIGQRDATTADSIVKMFKTLLPDVNKNLVELVRKERNNLWKEVTKPTPLSVFVHNAQDQVQYKSSVIFAALAKAKQTFNETLNDTKTNNDVVTEDIPFLRTPTVYRSVSSVGTPLMKSKVIEQNEQGVEYGPSPCKRLKLSPRTSKQSPVKSRNLSFSTIQSKLSTPIIRRKRLSIEPSNTTTVVPQSILKGSSVSRTILDDSILDENTSVNTSLQLECENSVRRSRLTLTPRKPVSRTPLKSHVKFDDLRYSNSSNEQNNSILHNLLPETNRRQSVNSTASTVDEVFYSPENSPGEDDHETATETAEQELQKKALSPVREKLSFDESITGNDVMKEQPRKMIETAKIPVEENDLSTNRLTFQSPRSRRSYKRSFGESPVPVRSSPRLAKKSSQEDDQEESTAGIAEDAVNKSESLMKPSPSIAVQKLRGRKSLSRAVLENNAFSKLGASNIFEKRNILESRSSASSLNTTTTDSESEIDINESHNDSLEELLKKYGTSALESDTSFNLNDSLPSNTSKNVDTLDEGQVVSNTTEMLSTKTYRESLTWGNKREIISSKETRDKYHSKQVEGYESEERQGLGDGDPFDISCFDETTQEFHVNVSKNNKGTMEDDKNSEAGDSDVSENHKFLNQGENDEITEQNEEINVYEDLSSGSEDLREVLKQFKNRGDDEKIYADISFSTSLSYYQNEKKDELMPRDIMESGEASSNDGASRSPRPEHVYDNDIDMEETYDDIPASDKNLVDAGEVIEIGSSSDEEDDQKRNKQEPDETSTSGSNSSSEEKSYSSNDQGNDIYDVYIGFEDNLNEASNKAIKVDESDEEQVAGSIQEKHIQSGHHSEKELERKPKEIESKVHPALEVPLELSGDERSANIDDRSELDQREAAAAVKMLEVDAFAEEQQVVLEDEEHMDSLILEDLDVAIIQEQTFEENPKENEELVPQQASDENAQLRKEEALQDDEVTTENLDKQEPSLFPLKQAVSVQKEDGSASPRDDKSMNLQKDPVKSNNATDPVDVEGKATPVSVEKQSKSLQCTLGVQSTDRGALEEEASSSPLKQSRSLQCTLGDNDSIMGSTIDDTSVFLKDNEDMDLTKDPGSDDKALDLTEHRSKSVQTDLNEVSSVMETSRNNEISASIMEEESRENTPLVLRTVKKTYLGRKASERSVDLDATPKLLVTKSILTYSKRNLRMGSEVSATSSNVENSQAEPQESSEPKQELDEPKINNKETKTLEVEPEASMDVEEQHQVSRDAENKEKASTFDSAQQTLSQDQDSDQISVSNDENTKEDATRTQESDNSKTKNETAAKPSVRMTRRRSMLLSQQEETPSSASEKSVGSSGGNRTRTQDSTTQQHAESSASQATTVSQTLSFMGTKTQFSTSTFDSTLFIGSPIVRAEGDIMERLSIDGNSIRVTRDVFDVDEKMEEKKSPRDKAGPSKVKARRSSKSSTKDGPSSSQKRAPYAVPVSQLKKRARSASVDQPSTSVRKRSVRSKSIDLDNIGPMAEPKIALRVMLQPIEEQAGSSTEKDVPKEEVPKRGTKAYSDVGGYTSSRRLTRRQASMLKTIGKVEEKQRQLPSVEEIDPVHLLDKSDFAGKPDPDESKVYEHSSPSSSSGTPSRHTRSASVLSDLSTPPKKQSKAKSQLGGSVSGIKSRLRKASTDTMSVASEQSDSPSPSKRAKKKDDESETQDDSQTVTRGKKGRSRTSSISSIRSATSEKTESSVRTTRSRKIQSAKSELPEIREEKGSDEGAAANTSVIKKRGRKK